MTADPSVIALAGEVREFPAVRDRAGVPALVDPPPSFAAPEPVAM